MVVEHALSLDCILSGMKAQQSKAFPASIPQPLHQNRAKHCLPTGALSYFSAQMAYVVIVKLAMPQAFAEEGRDDTPRLFRQLYSLSTLT